MKADLSIKWKFSEFKVFEEAALDPAPLVDSGFALRGKGQRLPDRLLWFTQTVLNVQLWVPVPLPLNVLDILKPAQTT